MLGSFKSILGTNAKAKWDVYFGVGGVMNMTISNCCNIGVQKRDMARPSLSCAVHIYDTVEHKLRILTCS
jgi:hypothetical protein